MWVFRIAVTRECVQFKVILKVIYTIKISIHASGLFVKGSMRSKYDCRHTGFRSDTCPWLRAQTILVSFAMNVLERVSEFQLDPMLNIVDHFPVLCERKTMEAY